MKRGEFLVFENKNSNQRRIKHPKIRETSNDKCDQKDLLRSKRILHFSHLFEGGPLPRVEGVGVAVAGVILRN